MEQFSKEYPDITFTIRAISTGGITFLPAKLFSQAFKIRLLGWILGRMKAPDVVRIW